MKNTLRPTRVLPFLILLLPAVACWASTCDSGRRQSPIDITASRRQKLPALTFDYRASPLRIADDGRTVRVRFDNQLYIAAQRYTLQQFHFHAPGGDRIAGEEFPMAAHLLHRNAAGQLLAVVVLFRVGNENPLLASLLPLVPAPAEQDHRARGIVLDVSDLLPAARGYYRYRGSLTAPPCTEGVDWIVLKQPLQLSATQLARYRERFADHPRPLQQRHQRVVLESL